MIQGRMNQSFPGYLMELAVELARDHLKLNRVFVVRIFEEEAVFLGLMTGHHLDRRLTRWVV